MPSIFSSVKKSKAVESLKCKIQAFYEKTLTKIKVRVKRKIDKKRIKNYLNKVQGSF